MKSNSRNIILVSLAMLLLYSCENRSRKNNGNIFYIDYITDNDTLLSALKKSTSGKASYFDNSSELLIVPVNYLTEEHPNTHYFKLPEELNNDKPALNDIKYQLTFNGSRINDSIAYDVKKFIYTKDGWTIKSEMGVIKIFNYLADYDKKLKIISSNIATTVIKTIAADTYSN